MPTVPGFLPGQHPIDGLGGFGFRFADMSHRGSLLALPSGLRAFAPSRETSFIATGSGGNGLRRLRHRVRGGGPFHESRAGRFWFTRRSGPRQALIDWASETWPVGQPAVSLVAEKDLFKIRSARGVTGSRWRAGRPERTLARSPGSRPTAYWWSGVCRHPVW